VSIVSSLESVQSSWAYRKVDLPSLGLESTIIILLRAADVARIVVVAFVEAFIVAIASTES